MLYHVHHVLNDVDTVRESFAQFEPAKRLAVDLVAVYGGNAYITRASVVQWDSDAANRNAIIATVRKAELAAFRAR
jgi:hypothetical protein